MYKKFGHFLQRRKKQVGYQDTQSEKMLLGHKSERNQEKKFYVLKVIVSYNSWRLVNLTESR